MEGTKKRIWNLSMYITGENSAINTNPDFKEIRRSAHSIDNKILFRQQKWIYEI